MWIEYDGVTGEETGIILTDAGMTARETMGTTEPDGHTWCRDGGTGQMMRLGAACNVLYIYRYVDGRPGSERTEQAGAAVVRLRAELAQFETWKDGHQLSGDYRVNEVISGLRTAVRHLEYLTGEAVDNQKKNAFKALKASGII